MGRMPCPYHRNYTPARTKKHLQPPHFQEALVFMSVRPCLPAVNPEILTNTDCFQLNNHTNSIVTTGMCYVVQSLAATVHSVPPADIATHDPCTSPVIHSQLLKVSTQDCTGYTKTRCSMLSSQWSSQDAAVASNCAVLQLVQSCIFGP